MSNVTISSECPRFNECNVNNCPLHIMYPHLIIDKEDKEKKCTMEKGVRVRIGSKYPELKYRGLTKSEWAAKKTYENLSDEEKKNKIERAHLLSQFKIKKVR